MKIKEIIGKIRLEKLSEKFRKETEEFLTQFVNEKGAGTEPLDLESMFPEKAKKR